MPQAPLNVSFPTSRLVLQPPTLLFLPPDASDAVIRGLNCSRAGDGGISLPRRMDAIFKVPLLIRMFRSVYCNYSGYDNICAGKMSLLRETSGDVLIVCGYTETTRTP